MDQMTIYLGADHIISACGASTDETFDAMLGYKSGVRLTADPSLSPEPLPLGRIDRRGVPHRDGNTFLEDLLQESVGRVLAESGVDPATAGLVIATTKGNIGALAESLAPDARCYIARSMERVARNLGFESDPVVISNACISGIAALVVARRMMLARGIAHVVVAGVDVLSEFVVSGFRSFKSLDGQVCRPYDETRRGLSLGEACGAVLLTADPAKAGPRAVCLTGGALTEDANHLSAPSRTGAELAEAMRQALAESGVTAAEVDFVNAHGTGTVYNDEMESKALAAAGLIDKPLNSLKPYLGHTLGASGVVETILTAEQLRRGILLGTPGFGRCGTPHQVRVCPRHTSGAMSTALKSGSGFGGCNAAVVLRLVPSAGAVPQHRDAVLTGGWSMEGEGDFAERIRAEYKALGCPDMRFFKMDDLEKLGYVAVENLWREHPLTDRYDPFRVGIILANRSASLATDIRHQRLLDTHPEEGTSPAVFVYTLPNIVAGEISIRHAIRGESLFFVAESPDRSPAEDYARLLVGRGTLDAAIVGWCDYLNGKYSVKLNILEKK